MRRLEGVTHVLSYGEPLPDFDVHCPMATLPGIFETRLDTIPAAVPYLRASPQDVAKWHERLGPKKRPRIGINWAGYSGVTRDSLRSIGLPGILPLLSIADVEFFSIQKVLRPGDKELLASHSNVVHLGDESGDFQYTAALMENARSGHIVRHIGRSPRRRAGQTGLDFAGLHSRLALATASRR